MTAEFSQKAASHGFARPRRKATTPRAESKGAKILDMIARAKGATLSGDHEGRGLAGPQRQGFHLRVPQSAASIAGHSKNGNWRYASASQ